MEKSALPQRPALFFFFPDVLTGNRELYHCPRVLLHGITVLGSHIQPDRSFHCNQRILDPLVLADTTAAES
jgi:hypothetical protein